MSDHLITVQIHLTGDVYVDVTGEPTSPHCFGDIGDDGLALPTGMPGPMSAPAMRSALHLLQLLGWETGDDEASARTAVELRALDTVHAIIEAHLANLSASAETGDPCEIPAPAISQSLSEAVTLPTEPSLTRTDDIVQRARQALDAWPGQPITDDDRRVNAVIGSITVAQYDLVRDLLALVEVALPTITTQRDDALAEVADLLKVDHQCAAVDEAWAADRAERDELRATIERVTDEVQFLNARDQILIRAALDQGKP